MTRTSTFHESIFYSDFETHCWQIALADHPEWGRGHTVFGDVVPVDMAIVEEIVRQPTRTTPGKIPITNLQSPVKFSLERL